MSITLIQSGKGKPQILIDGYRLNLNKKPTVKNSMAYFYCVKKDCPIKAATVGELKEDKMEVKYHNRPPILHNHPADDMDNKIQQQHHEFREKAQENPDQPAKPLYEALTAARINSMDSPKKEEYLEKLPSFDNKRGQFYRIHEQVRPKIPKSVEEVSIPAYGNLTETTSRKALYHGKTASCSELFMSDVQIDIAERSTELFIDGTFATCPRPFYQTLYLRGKVGNNDLTIAHALFPNKQEQTYKDVLQKVQDVYTEADKPINFMEAHMDCEKAIINATKAVFPNCTIQLCYFHVTDAICRHAAMVGLTDSKLHFYDRDQS